MDDQTIAEIAGKLTAAQRDGLLPCSPNRHLLPRNLIHWRVKFGHRYPSPKLNTLGYRVRAYLKDQGNE